MFYVGNISPIMMHLKKTLAKPRLDGLKQLDKVYIYISIIPFTSHPLIKLGYTLKNYPIIPFTTSNHNVSMICPIKSPLGAAYTTLTTSNSSQHRRAAKDADHKGKQLLLLVLPGCLEVPMN
jgi:hypothetical protein